jgi:dihydroorotate dehydrogenase electron transfer subunit
LLTAKLSIQNKVYHLQSLITDQKEISSGYFRLIFSAPQIAQIAQPGQFVHIYCGEGTYLRRPFSIAKVKKNQVEIIYKVVGKGTELLSRKKKGNTLDVLGPLGNGFTQSLNHPITQSPILIAGGTGVASLLFLAQKLITLYTSHLTPLTVFLGAKTKNDLLCIDNFKKLGCQVKLATEDGSLGYKGLVTDLFRNSLITHNSSLITNIYACGPYAMLKEIAKITQKYKIPYQVSLEAMMACGLGACRGCVVKTSHQSLTTSHQHFVYKTVCKDGPVFEANQIIWE